MIASLRGEVISIGLNYAIIECAGVGYHITATPATLATLRRGEEAFIRTAMVVREDAQLLYGFSSDESREMFGILQSVSGVGPQLALAAVAVLNPQEMAAAIAGEDVKTLQRIPGVGKKVAQRLVLELKDKVAGWVAEPDVEQVERSSAISGSGVRDEVTQALVGLGFAERQAQGAVEHVMAGQDTELNTSAILRAALGRLGGK